MHVALIFPGQGAQFVGMCKDFYESSSEAKAVFDAADQLIPGLSEVMFNGPAEKLTSTRYCQPAIFTFSMAALAAFQATEQWKKIHPKFAAGLSLGELSAVCASGALSFEDALKLVERRASFMDEACKKEKGAMAAVIGMDRDKVVELARQCEAEVANFNSPDQIVITGKAQAVADASAVIKEQGAKRVIPLDVSGAFHSSLMKSALPLFEAELQKVNFVKPQLPVLSNVDAQPTDDVEVIRRNLAKQIISSVRWVETVESIAEAGCEEFIEVGPGTVLKGLIRKINPELKVCNIQKIEDLQSISAGV